MPTHQNHRHLATLFLLALLLPPAAAAQDTTITYQGQLRQNGVPFTETADLEFRLFDASSGGSQVGMTLSRPNWPVEDGLFQVELDFGLAAFGEQVRYLEVRVNGTPLSPRQAIRPSPMALFALAGNEGPAGPQGSPGATGAQGPIGPPGPAGASPFSLDAVTGAIEYRFGEQVFRFQPDTDPDTQFSTGESPRVTLGHANNRAEQFGDTVSGGGVSANPNIASGGMSTVSGGQGNAASGFGNSVGGGSGNAATDTFSTVSGGSFNIASAFHSTIGGGQRNRANNQWSFIGGGQDNAAGARFSTVGGGQDNAANGEYAVISGGLGNLAGDDADTVGGGADNTASGVISTVVGGDSNTASGFRSTVGGGSSNCAGGSSSWAGGRRAKVRPGTASGALGQGCQLVFFSGDANGDEGTFVWADSQEADFVSSGPNQFLVRAAGGMGINTNDPETQLHIIGPSPGSDPFGQLRLEGSETTGAAGTGAGVSFLGHDGNIRRIWGYIESVKENATVGNTRSRMSFYTRGASGLPAEGLRIDSNGDVTTPNGIFSTASDRRLKQDIQPLSGSLDRLLGLQGVHFRYKDELAPFGDTRPRMGFIAQQVEQVLPEWVSVNGDGYKQITPIGFQALIVEALRELRDQQKLELADLRLENEELGAEVAALQSQAEQLKELAKRNAELEQRMATLEEMLLVGRRLAGAQ